MNVNAKVIMNEIMRLSLREKTEMIGWIAKSIEEESLKLQTKNILGYSGILKGKQDALKFERDIRNEWERQVSY
jgi:hypothetical protein